MGIAVKKIIREAVSIAQKAVAKPYSIPMPAPMASSAKKEILPIAVFAMSISENLRNDFGAYRRE